MSISPLPTRISQVQPTNSSLQIKAHMSYLERSDSGIVPPALPVFTTTADVEPLDISIYSEPEPESDFDFDDSDSDDSCVMDNTMAASLTGTIVHVDPAICGESRWHTVSSPSVSSRARALSTAGILPEIDTAPFTCDFSPLFTAEPGSVSDLQDTRDSLPDSHARDALPLPENTSHPLMQDGLLQFLDLSLPEPELDIPLYTAIPRRRSTGSFHPNLEIHPTSGSSVLPVPVIEPSHTLRPRLDTPPLPRRSPLRKAPRVTMHVSSPRDSTLGRI